MAAFSLCPCHLPILLAIFRAGAIGGALARNQGVLFIALGALSAFALWRYLRTFSRGRCPDFDYDKRVSSDVTTQDVHKHQL